VVVTDALAFEVEPNSTSDPLRSLDGVSGGMGYLQSTAIQQYSSRVAFDTDHPSLPLEDFESGVVDAEDITSFAGPLDATTSNSAFPTGITSGLTIEASNPSGDLALVGADFFDAGDPGSQVVGADLFTDDIVLRFSPGVFAVGVDIFAENDVFVFAFDSNDATIVGATVPASADGSFWGLVSDTAIERVLIQEVGISSSGELIDNVAFGVAGTTPQPDEDFFELTLNSGQTVLITTSTPLDDPANSLLNDLNPGLSITGPSTSLFDLNSAPDGKNAQIALTAPQTGVYTIQIAPESGSGEYLLSISGDGDFDQDGDVDGGDFLEWQRGFGTNYDASDLNTWQTNYGVANGLAGSSALNSSPHLAKSMAAPLEPAAASQPLLDATGLSLRTTLPGDSIAAIHKHALTAAEQEQTIFVAEDTVFETLPTNSSLAMEQSLSQQARRVADVDAAIAELSASRDEHAILPLGDLGSELNL
jgi:hypothetical protein